MFNRQKEINEMQKIEIKQFLEHLEKIKDINTIAESVYKEVKKQYGDKIDK